MASFNSMWALSSHANCSRMREVERVVNRITTSYSEVVCVTENEGFYPVCLNVWVLQTAYLELVVIFITLYCTEYIDDLVTETVSQCELG